VLSLGATKKPLGFRFDFGLIDSRLHTQLHTNLKANILRIVVYLFVLAIERGAHDTNADMSTQEA
jgi:hypothetical protein